MKILNRLIFEHVISAIIFVIFAIVLTVIITMKVIQNNIHNTYKEDNVMIEIEPKINRQLDKLTDIEGLNSKYNVINITNNDNVIKKYQILLSPINDNENDIRIYLDNYLIRDLSYYKKEDNSYILYESELKPDFSILHQVRVWQAKNSDKDKINVNFKLSVRLLKDSDNV